MFYPLLRNTPIFYKLDVLRIPKNTHENTNGRDLFQQGDIAAVSNFIRKRALSEVPREDLQINYFSKHLLVAISDTLEHEK